MVYTAVEHGRTTTAPGVHHSTAEPYRKNMVVSRGTIYWQGCGTQYSPIGSLPSSQQCTEAAAYPGSRYGVFPAAVSSVAGLDSYLVFIFIFCMRSSNTLSSGACVVLFAQANPTTMPPSVFFFMAGGGVRDSFAAVYHFVVHGLGWRDSLRG